MAAAMKDPAMIRKLIDRSSVCGKPSGSATVDATWLSAQPAAAFAMAVRAA